MIFFLPVAPSQRWGKGVAGSQDPSLSNFNHFLKNPNMLFLSKIKKKSKYLIHEMSYL